MSAHCGHCGGAYREPEPPEGPAAIAPNGSIITFKTTEKAARYVQRNPDFTLVPGNGV